MNPPKPSPSAETPQWPLPGRQFQRFVMVFHVVFLTGMLVVLFNRWQRSGGARDGTDVLVTVLVLSQVASYIRFFAWPAPEPVMRRRFAFYFPLSFGLWFLTWRLEPAFEWVVLGYLGQLFGALPPKFSIPGGAAVFLFYLPAKVGWAGLARLSAREWLGYASLVVVWSALGLFLHKLVVTSAERAKLIKELEAAHKQLELARERDTELAALRERERLARELHDSLGHGLVTLTVQLEAAQRLYTVDPARASTLMDEMKSVTRTSMEQLRRSLAGLRAPGLGDRPLGPALRELCAEIAKRASLSVHCEVPEDLARVSPAVAEVFWRVAQEGLANVEKHARATSARVVLEVTPDSRATAGSGAMEAMIRVVDDGVGLTPGAEGKPGHYGLRGVRERVEGLGGAFHATTVTPKGTRLEARLPVA